MIRHLLAIVSVLVAISAIFVIATSALAIDLPDSTPTVDDIWCFQHVIETGDFLIIILETTPYATPPSVPYDKAFVWRLFDTDGMTEIDQAVGYTYHERGYGYNVISWYFNADEAPTWGENYYIRLTGLPTEFLDPYSGTFQIADEDYSELTDNSEVLIAISDLIIDIAEDLNIDWSLEIVDYLTTSSEMGVVLSVKGESFFRGAIYGIQSMAPYAFSYNIGDINNTWRTWSEDYTANLSTQFEGNYIGTGLDAGNEMLGVDYNLFGLLGLGLSCIILIGACIAVGGDVWGSAVMAAGVVVIGARMTLADLTIVALAAAICWIFISGKVWKLF
jgi:hypothetical protein